MYIYSLYVYIYTHTHVYIFPPKESVKVEFLLAQLPSKEIGGLKSAFKSVKKIEILVIYTFFFF